MNDHFFVIFYTSYGQQLCTVGFEREMKARDHIHMQLDRPDKDYIKEITLCQIHKIGGKIDGMTVLPWRSQLGNT